MALLKWEVDTNHSLIEFSVKHMMIAKVKGLFEHYQSKVDFDPYDLTTAVICFSIDANSLTTRHAQRDEHLKSDLFLHVDEYPYITFQSSGFTRVNDDEYDLTGDLTIRGVTRPTTFRTTYEGVCKDHQGTERAGFSAKTSIQRSDFGLNFNIPLESGGVVVGNEVKIELSIETALVG